MFHLDELLSLAGRFANHAFQNRPGERNRAEFIHDVKSLAWQYAETDEWQHPLWCYANFAIRDVRAGRHFSATVRSVDSLKKLRGRFVRTAEEDTTFDLLSFVDHNDPAEAVALKIDFEGWMESLTDQQCKAAKLLAVGHTTQEVAEQLQCTEGNVSQYRRRLMKSWYRYIGTEE